MDTLFVRVETKMMENKGNAGRKFSWEIPVVKLSAHNADGYNLQYGIHGRVEVKFDDIYDVFMLRYFKIAKNIKIKNLK